MLHAKGWQQDAKGEKINYLFLGFKKLYFTIFEGFSEPDGAELSLFFALSHLSRFHPCSPVFCASAPYALRSASCLNRRVLDQ
ncbi:MAG TPA: hypothetical protein PKV48_00165 [Thermodesulfobacteriota bacterium]|nr:hypothetical protein [Thermodesulfobacteriota bacterium]